MAASTTNRRSVHILGRCPCPDAVVVIAARPSAKVSRARAAAAAAVVTAAWQATRSDTRATETINQKKYCIVILSIVDKTITMSMCVWKERKKKKLGVTLYEKLASYVRGGGRRRGKKVSVSGPLNTAALALGDAGDKRRPPGNLSRGPGPGRLQIPQLHTHHSTRMIHAPLFSP